MRRRRPPTKLVRIRKEDVTEMQEEAKRLNKQMPDFVGEMYKLYKGRKKR